jgi:prepilin-type N-terminal cleavage/methylation domain-containing protein
MSEERGRQVESVSRRASKSLDGDAGRPKVSRFRRRSANDEKGFTLIELLIVTSVMPIIVGAITAGLFTVISLSSSVSGRLGDSGDAQVVSSTFIKDVQSATFITTDATSTPQCGTSGSQLLGLQWGNSPLDITLGNSSNPSTLVSYDIVQSTVGTTTTYSLDREYCGPGAFSTPAITVVANNIGGPGVQPPPCTDAAGCDPYDTQNGHNPPIAWTSSSAVPLVNFEIKELSSGYEYTLAANSLDWTPPGANSGTVAPPFSPLTLLNQTAGVGSSLSMQAGTVLNITGTGAAGTTVAFASPNDSSASIPGDAALSASSLFTEDPNLLSVTGAGLGASTPQYYTPSIPDPLASTFNAGTAPPASSGWPLSSTACTVTGTVYNCPAGLYNSDPGFVTGSTVNFTGFQGLGGYGNYEFANTLKIPTNSTITFGQGEYVFDGSPAISPDAVQVQTLTWTSTPPTTPVIGTLYPLTATASSGLTPTFSLGTGSTGCSLTAGVVKITATPDTCLVNANQAGNASYGPADQIQQVIPIPKSGKSVQTITFTSTQPTSEAINATYTPTATAGTGVTVIFTATGSCSINGSNLVTFGPGAGTCDINANAAANGTYIQAPEAQQAIAVIAGTGVTTITGNNVLFYVSPSGGSVNFGGTTSVELTPLGSGLAIWDASSNPATTVTITNVATSRNTYGGIYVPGGSVNVTSNSFTGSMSVMFIVAQSVNMAQQLTLNVTGP